MKKNLYFLIACLLLSPFYSAQTLAQQAKPKSKRPKIGLVLSGGGAKGLAHIGVLKVLEELNIKPDYITGVSMGSIVGGLYSLGYSAHDLDSIVNALDWKRVFSDEINYRQVGINEKSNYRSYQLNLSGNSLKNIDIPLGVVQGQLISEFFSDLCWRSIGLQSFDDFPIPFRCLASDIISGQSVIFDSGNLAKAMRASMAIPSAFTPVKNDSMLLVDGGVINNFPVQECIDMGADIIIGVYVGSKENSSPDDYVTMIQVLSQSASFMGAINAKKQMKKLDIKILPDITPYGIESFGKAEEIVQVGEKAAREKLVYAQLKALADSIHQFPPENKQSKIYTHSSIQIHRILVEGLKYTNPNFVVALSQLKENSNLTKKQLNLALNRLYGSLLFDKVEYHFEKEKGQYNLIFEVMEKNLVTANASVYYDSYFGAGLLFHGTYKRFMINTSKIDLSIDVSKYPRASLAYTIIGGKKKRLFFSTRIETQGILIPNFYEFSNNLLVSLGQFTNNQLRFSTSMSYSLSTNSKVEIKASQVNNFFHLEGGLEKIYNIDKVSANHLSLEASYEINTLDNPVFPTAGAWFKALFRKVLDPHTSYTAPEGLFKEISTQNDIVVVDYKHYVKIGQRFSLIPEFTLAYMSSIPFYADKFFLGGSGFNTRLNTFNQAGVEPYHIATDNFIKFGLGLQMKIASEWYFSASGEVANFINNAETLTPESLRLNGERISGWVSSLAYDSVLGPLKITISQNTINHNFYFYLSIGFPF